MLRALHFICGDKLDTRKRRYQDSFIGDCLASSLVVIGRKEEEEEETTAVALVVEVVEEGWGGRCSCTSHLA